MKKILFVITLAIVLTLVGTLCSCSCEPENEENGIAFYELPDGTYEVGIGSDKNLEKAVIPKTFNGKPVVKIRDDGFSGCIKLTSVKIPSSVTSIGNRAFKECTGLKEIEIPDGVEYIGDEAFSGLSGVKEIEIPDSVKSIGRCALDGCINLESVKIPFVGKGENADYKEYAFGHIFGYYSQTGTYEAEKLDYYGSGDGKYYIPLSLKRVYISGGGIPYGSFANCTSIESVIVGKNVTSIERRAFYNCTSLSSLTFEDGGRCESICELAFYNTALKEVIIPISVWCMYSDFSEYGENVFGMSEGLTIYCEAAEKPIKWQKNWNEFGNPVVWGYNNITTNPEYDYVVHENKAHLTKYKGDGGSVVIPAYIDGYEIASLGLAFQGNNKIGKITISKEITSISPGAFYSCEGLASVTFEEGSKCTKIGINAFGAEYSSRISPTSVYVSDIEFWLRINFESTSSNPLCRDGRLFVNGKLLEELVVPEGITAVLDNAFVDCEYLKSIVIASSVTSIGEYAFFECENVESIVFKEGSELEKIERDAFYCPSNHNYKLTSIEIPSNVTSLGYSAIYGFEALKEVYNYSALDEKTIIDALGTSDISIHTKAGDSKLIKTEDVFVFQDDGENMYLIAYTGEEKELILPQSCNGKSYDIGSCAFFDCDSIRSVIIPEGVRVIGEDAFAYCTSLRSVTVPSSLERIENSAFGSCMALFEVYNQSSLKIEKGSAENGGIAYYALQVHTATDTERNIFETNDGFVFYNNGEQIYLIDYVGNRSDIVLPESYNGADYKIYDCAFSGNDVIVNVTIRNGVTDISDRAFYECKNLVSIDISDCVKSIGFWAFYGCESLESVRLPNGLEYIKSYAFRNCVSLSSITIPRGLKGIGDEVFYACASLESVYISDLTSWLNLNFSSEISSPLFHGATLYLDGSPLTDVVLPTSVKSIKNYTFFGCSSLKNITFTSSVSSIGASAFSGCTGLTKIILPGDLSDLGSNAFSGCTGLTEIVLPSSLSSIGRGAFSGCTALNSVALPEGISTINEKAFYGCTGLTEIILPSSVTYIGKSAFAECGKLLLNKYDNAFYLGSATNPYFALIMAKDRGTLVVSSKIQVIAKGALDSLGANSKNEYKNAYYIGSEETPYFILLEEVDYDVKECYINANAKFICGRAFFFSSNDLETVVFESGSKCEVIGENAFYNCSRLTSINIPDSVRIIEDMAFYECERLRHFYVSSTSRLERIGGSAFYGCDISSIEFPSSLKEIGAHAFNGCGLYRVEIPKSVLYIGRLALRSTASSTIYCEANSKPAGWDEEWTNRTYSVVWGYKQGE